MSLTEVIDSCIKSLRNRLTSPFWFTYSIVWVISNYEIWMILFYSRQSVEGRILEVKTEYSNPLFVFGLPFIISIAIVALGPWISALYQWYILKPYTVASTQKTKQQLELARIRTSLTKVELQEKREIQRYERQMDEEKEERDFQRRQRQIQLEHELQEVKLRGIEKELKNKERDIEARELRIDQDRDRFKLEKQSFDEDVLSRERRLEELDKQAEARNKTLSSVNEKINLANNELNSLQADIKDMENTKIRISGKK